jgi:hypothetical protein
MNRKAWLPLVGGTEHLSSSSNVSYKHGNPKLLYGIGLKFANEERHDGPREEAITLWGTEKCQFAG